MESRFHSDLEQLKMTILHMATLTEKALEKSVKALVERNDDLARGAQGDHEINLLEVDVDRHSLDSWPRSAMARDCAFISGECVSRWTSNASPTRP